MGIEPHQKTRRIQSVRAKAAQNPAHGAPEAPLDPALSAVVAAWPQLPEPIKAGILALVRAALPAG